MNLSDSSFNIQIKPFDWDYPRVDPNKLEPRHFHFTMTIMRTFWIYVWLSCNSQILSNNLRIKSFDWDWMDLRQSMKVESNSVTNRIVFWIWAIWAKLTYFQNFHFHCDDNGVFKTFQWDLKHLIKFNSIWRIFIIFIDITNLVKW